MGVTISRLISLLGDYEIISGQKVNAQKSCFITGSNISTSRRNWIANWTGFQPKQLPIKYFGCTLYVGRRSAALFDDLVMKIKNRIASWNGKLLSQGGRLCLIKSVLAEIPSHILAAVSPPRKTITHINSLISNFFWGGGPEPKKVSRARLGPLIWFS